MSTKIRWNLGTRPGSSQRARAYKQCGPPAHRPNRRHAALPSIAVNTPVRVRLRGRSAQPTGDMRVAARAGAKPDSFGVGGRVSRTAHIPPAPHSQYPPHLAIANLRRATS